METKTLVKLMVAGFVLIVILALLFSSFEIINAGERGIVLRWGAYDRVLGEGFQIVNPISSDIITVSVRTQVISYDNQEDTTGECLGAASKDLQDVSMCIIVNYHQKPDMVGKIYQEYGLEYQGNVLEPMVKEAVKSISSQFTAEELVTKRTEVSDLIGKNLEERFDKKYSIMEKFNIVNFTFSESFSRAIEAKVTAEQDALAAKNKLEQVKFEKEQRITQAQGEAEAIRIQAQAIQQQGGAEYVNLKAIEKWSGNLPTYFMGTTVPFINLN